MANTNGKHFTDAIDHGTSGDLFNDRAQLYLEKILQSQASLFLPLNRFYPSSPENQFHTRRIHHHKHHTYKRKTPHFKLPFKFFSLDRTFVCFQMLYPLNGLCCVILICIFYSVLILFFKFSLFKKTLQKGS